MSRFIYSNGGRRLMLLWTCLISAGLLCLIVEFIRSKSILCLQDSNQSSAAGISNYPTIGMTSCDLQCNGSDAHSILRKGRANEVNLVSAPKPLTFGTATLLSSACGIVIAVALASTCIKALEIDWSQRWSQRYREEDEVSTNESILELNQIGTGGLQDEINLKTTTKRDKTLRMFWAVLKVSVSTGCILVIIILGEVNFFSAQMRFRTEAMTTFSTSPKNNACSSPDVFIGQWSPLAGLAIATVGVISVYTSKSLQADDYPSPQSIYTPLKTFQFRIFELDAGYGDGSPIVGRLHVMSLKEPPKYTALSYVWGQEPDIHRIQVNNKNMKVRPNIFQALQRLAARARNDRHSSSQYLWIDSLCINQEDLSEKNVQVTQMANIYQRAENVILWLGEEDFASNSAISFIEQVVALHVTFTGTWWESYALTALSQLLGRPWFRRRWIIQEAAFSRQTLVLCGGQSIQLETVAEALDLLRARLNTAFASNANLASHAYPALYDSPATRILALVNNVFKPLDTNISTTIERRLSLEQLVDLSTFCEASDQRDTVFALLSLAKEQDVLSKQHPTYSLMPNYEMRLMDVFIGFVLHCCNISESLDIICRPWAPEPASIISSDQKSLEDRQFLSNLPSWIVSKNRLPFGDPSAKTTQRMHGRNLVGSPISLVYDAHLGTKPSITPGYTSDTSQIYNGSLLVRGLKIGEIERRSVRMANAVIPAESLKMFGVENNSWDRLSVWRILCADHDPECLEYDSRFRRAKLNPQTTQLIQDVIQTDNMYGEPEHLFRRRQSDPEISMDIEELLKSKDLSLDAKHLLTIVRDVVWNRCTFRARLLDASGSSAFGLAPSEARLGDMICILYGCSVPVVLRSQRDENDVIFWRLIGEAYVDGFMDGEAIKDLSASELAAVECSFEIW